MNQWIHVERIWLDDIHCGTSSVLVNYWLNRYSGKVFLCWAIKDALE
jgi:hypothetical protein